MNSGKKRTTGITARASQTVGQEGRTSERHVFPACKLVLSHFAAFGGPSALKHATFEKPCVRPIPLDYSITSSYTIIVNPAQTS